MKYEIPSEKTIAMTVMMVTNSEPVYNHMHTSTNVPPAPIIQVSCTKHLLNKVLFSPVQQILQELKFRCGNIVTVGSRSIWNELSDMIPTPQVITSNLNYCHKKTSVMLYVHFIC